MGCCTSGLVAEAGIVPAGGNHVMHDCLPFGMCLTNLPGIRRWVGTMLLKSLAKQEVWMIRTSTIHWRMEVSLGSTDLPRGLWQDQGLSCC